MTSSLKRPPPISMVLPDSPKDSHPTLNAAALKVRQAKKEMVELLKSLTHLQDLYAGTDFVPEPLLDRLTVLQTDLLSWNAKTARIEEEIPFLEQKNNSLVTTIKKLQSISRSLSKLMLALEFNTYKRNYHAQMREEESKPSRFPFCCFP